MADCASTNQFPSFLLHLLWSSSCAAVSSETFLRLLWFSVSFVMGPLVSFFPPSSSSLIFLLSSALLLELSEKSSQISDGTIYFVPSEKSTRILYHTIFPPARKRPELCMAPFCSSEKSTPIFHDTIFPVWITVQTNYWILYPHQRVFSHQRKLIVNPKCKILTVTLAKPKLIVIDMDSKREYKFVVSVNFPSHVIAVWFKTGKDAQAMLTSVGAKHYLCGSVPVMHTVNTQYWHRC